MIKDEIFQWIEFLLIKNIPGRIGVIIRQFYWSRRFRQGRVFLFLQGCTIVGPENICIGKNVSMMQHCSLYANNYGSIQIGDRVSVNSNVIFGASNNGKIVIANDVLIGPNVVIRASNHQYFRKDRAINQQGHTGGEIIIEEDVWIGANTVILPNVIIGKGSVIGAGAVVNKNIPPYVLAGGVPVKIIEENIRK